MYIFHKTTTGCLWLANSICAALTKTQQKEEQTNSHKRWTKDTTNKCNFFQIVIFFLSLMCFAVTADKPLRKSEKFK